MRRRRILVAPPVALSTIVLGAATTGCGTALEQKTGSGPGSGQALDLKSVATGLQTKTVGLIEAINAKNDAGITRAKAELAREADRAEDAVKSQTGPAANQVNSAVGHIRSGILSNDVVRLERAKGLLQQASQ